MTWIVVIGSTLTVLLWVVIYSFFPSSDFIDEVVVLYGNITFWSTVLLSATVALGKPKFTRMILFS
jgi:phospholipid-translocating ATPase